MHALTRDVRSKCTHRRDRTGPWDVSDIFSFDPCSVLEVVWGQSLEEYTLKTTAHTSYPSGGCNYNISLPSHCRIYVSSGASRDGQQCYRLGVRYGRMMICSRCFKSLSGKRQLYIFIPSANKSQSPCSLSTTLCLSAPSQLLASIMFDRARVRVSVSEVPSPIVSDMSRYAA
jgi:hypothetical protein